MEVTGHRALIPHASPLLKPDAASEIHQAEQLFFGFETWRQGATTQPPSLKGRHP